MNTKMAVVIGVGVGVCLLCNVLAQGGKGTPQQNTSHKSVLDTRKEIIAKYIAKLEKVPSDAIVFPDREFFHIGRVLGEYRAKAATTELLRLIHVRIRATRDDVRGAPSGLDIPPGWGPPQVEFPAAGALVKIGLPSIRAITDAIERPKAVLDKKEVIELYAHVVVSILGDDHAKTWLLEEKRHCPKGAESNYDRLLSADALKLVGGRKYRRKLAREAALSRPATQSAK